MLLTLIGSCVFVMVRKRHSRRRVQKGRGMGPYVVDFKQGIQVTKDLIRDLKKPQTPAKDKAMVAGYKRQYRRYKQGGGKKKLYSMDFG